MDQAEAKILEDIDQYGCSLMHIPYDGSPSFTYSIGVQKTSREPEAIIFGLGRELAAFVLNEYNRRIKNGEKFVAGTKYEGFLSDTAVSIVAVDPSHYKEYFGWCLWLYRGPNFSAFQIVYPSAQSKLFPWDAGVSSDFKIQQPVLHSSLH